MERRQRTRLVTVLVLGLVFGTGFVVGMAFDRTASATPADGEGVAAVPDDRERDDDDRRGRRGNLYERVDGLTPEQRARIDSIVDDFRADGRAIRHEWEEEYERRFEPRLDSLVARTRSDIRGVMTQEQAQRYDSLLSEHDGKREERRKDRDSDGGREN